MDFELTSEQKAVQQAAREFAEKEYNKDYNFEIERSHRFPREAVIGISYFLNCIKSGSLFSIKALKASLPSGVTHRNEAMARAWFNEMCSRSGSALRVALATRVD